jgi:hypothetical protein
MINPLVLSRQPCITPGAGHTLGKGFGGSGGGGGGVEGGPGLKSGGVVNGWETVLSKRAQPGTNATTAQTTATADRGTRIRMSPGYGLGGGVRQRAPPPVIGESVRRARQIRSIARSNTYPGVCD